jgi:uncharacterized protein
MQFDGFDWDAGNRIKCQRHSVSIREIEALFQGEPLVGPDVRHSSLERRFRAVGVTAKSRSLFVVFTFRTKDRRTLIRPISARFMHRKEIDAHEKKIPGI